MKYLNKFFIGMCYVGEHRFGTWRSTLLFARLAALPALGCIKPLVRSASDIFFISGRGRPSSNILHFFSYLKRYRSFFTRVSWLRNLRYPSPRHLPTTFPVRCHRSFSLSSTPSPACCTYGIMSEEPPATPEKLSVDMYAFPLARPVFSSQLKQKFSQSAQSRRRVMPDDTTWK